MSQATVKVRSSNALVPQAAPLPVQHGVTLGEVYLQCSDRLGLNDSMIVFVNGTEANSSHIIQPGDQIEYREAAKARGAKQ